MRFFDASSPTGTQFDKLGQLSAPSMCDADNTVKVLTPQPGDILVIEVPVETLPSTLKTLKADAEAAFGRDVKIVVLAGAHLSGVVRDGE